MEKLTITRALAKIKSNKAKVKGLIKDLTNSGVVVNGILVSGNFKNKSTDDFKINASSSLDSIQDLLTYITNMKVAIAKANVTTEVAYKGKDVSIIGLMNIKDELKELLEAYNKMSEEFLSVNAMHDDMIAKQEAQITRALEAALSNKSSLPKEFIDNISKQIRDNNSIGIYYVKSLEDVVNTKRMIEEELREIDFLLSEVNAITTIEF